MLRVLSQLRRNIMLDKIKFIDMGTLNQDSGFPVLAQMAENGSNRMFSWLMEAWSQR